MLDLDSDILLWINGHGNEWLDAMMWTISRSTTWIWLYALIVGCVIYRFRNWKTVLLIIAALGIAVGLSDWICSGVLKPLVCRLRPTHEPSIDPIRLVHGYVGGLYGFCSSHAANTMSVAFLSGLLLRNKYITPFLVLYVVLNCYSRMYLGVHYPSDIIAGLLVGALMAAGCYWALRRVLPADGEVARQGGS